MCRCVVGFEDMKDVVQIVGYHIPGIQRHVRMYGYNQGCCQPCDDDDVVSVSCFVSGVEFVSRHVRGYSSSGRSRRRASFEMYKFSCNTP